MPMDIEGALWAYAHEDEYPDMGGRGEAAIREAFEVRDRARAELERLEALRAEFHPRGTPDNLGLQIQLAKRILGKEGSA
jgi:hypothetical protein